MTTNTNMRQVHGKKAAECLESGLHTLFVSLDTAEPRTYESIRGGDLRRVVDNLQSFLKRRDETGGAGPRVVLVAVLMRSTLLQLPSLVRLATTVGVDGVSVQNLAQRLTEPDLPGHLQPLRRSVWQESLRPKDLPLAKKVFAAAQGLAQAGGVELKLPSLGPKPPRSRPGCDLPSTAMYVTFNGEAAPCCMIGLPERVSVGNVFRSGVAGVWNGRALQDFRAGLAEGRPPEVCRGCSVYRREF